MKERASFLMDSTEFEELPKRPPKDPAIWLTVYKNLDMAEYSNSEADDWITVRKGGFAIELQVTDELGKVIASESEN